MRSADIDDRMRCAVEGWRPVYCAICLRPSGSGCCASTSSSRIMRSITWIGLLCSSLADIDGDFTACDVSGRFKAAFLRLYGSDREGAVSRQEGRRELGERSGGRVEG